MNKDGQDLISAVTISARKLQQGIDMHCCLVTSMLEGRVDEIDLRSFTELCPKQRSRERILKEAVQEAIAVLEESKKSFKSKQLEALRKKLTRALIDSG